MDKQAGVPALDKARTLNDNLGKLEAMVEGCVQKKQSDLTEIKEKLKQTTDRYNELRNVVSQLNPETLCQGSPPDVSKMTSEEDIHLLTSLCQSILQYFTEQLAMCATNGHESVRSERPDMVEPTPRFMIGSDGKGIPSGHCTLTQPQLSANLQVKIEELQH